MVLPLIEESVVPVASKNINNGEIPEPRTALALSVRGPLPAEQATPLEPLIVTVVDCVALPPGPVQLSV